MLITPINSKIQSYTQRPCQSTQCSKVGNSYNTNPLAYDTFSPSVSFKAAIHDYAAKGDLEGVKQELANGVDVNLVDPNDHDNSALYKAACNGKVEVVKELLKHPDIDVNYANKSNNDTALTIASFKGYTEIVKELLKHDNINVNKQNHYPDNALTYASFKGYIEMLKELLLQPDIDVNTSNSGLKTPLMLAVRNDHPGAAIEILKHPNVNINLKDEDGKTALDHAKDKKYPDIIKMIEDYIPGVDRREGIKSYFKKPPVDIAKLSPEENIWTKKEISIEFLKLINDKKYDDAVRMLEITPLIDLELNNKNILIRVMETKNPDFAEKVFDYKRAQNQMQAEYDTRRKDFLENTIKSMGYEELHFNNVALNTMEGFRILMDNPEFNPNDTVENSSLFERACILDPEGNLAKDILSKYGDVYTADAAKTRNQVIKDLINNYEKIGKYRIILNSIENNAFYADERRNIAANQLKELLESKDFTPEIADEVGNSVLHIAAALPDDMGRTLIQLALDKGVDINSGNCTGQRPLMSAIKKLVTTEDDAGKRNLMSNIKFLLDKGVDINAQDNNGQTAFHFACISTVGALLTLLLSKNPNVFLLDKQGNRAAKYLKTPEMKEIYNKYLGAV